jgi:uroporphyrin-III C-methyltransferase / precorrin-2 dehydrogenase / sirohydrochlorin ferrochelatase
VQAAKEWREKIKQRGLDAAEHRRFWERFVDRAESHAEREPGPDDLSALMREADRRIQSPSALLPWSARVRAIRNCRRFEPFALRTADVILYDDLVAPAILEFARREARRMLVGKTSHGPACRQDDINRLMVTLAKAGRRVVRLKSGDPLIFGRAGEEMVPLTKADISFEIVPGISAVQGSAARLKVSLTHRNRAERVQLVTAHDGRLPKDLCWRTLSDSNVTTAVYMPQRTLSDMVVRLQQAGLSENCPAVAVLAATRLEERVVVSTIADLPGHLANEPDTLPWLVLFGRALNEVVATAHRTIA